MKRINLIIGKKQLVIAGLTVLLGAAVAVNFAVDSASGIMGSGVSDVWDSYVSGMRVTCGSVGFSGAVLLLAAGFRPLLRLGATMLLLHVIGVLLDMLGEATTARAAQRMGDAVQMALELCSGALAIAGILLGAGMAAGRGVLA